MDEELTFNRLSGRRNLYLISQTDNDGYDTFSDAVVAAWTEDEARNIHPSQYVYPGEEWDLSSWCEPISVDVKFIGIADKDLEGVVCACFHAG